MRRWDGRRRSSTTRDLLPDPPPDLLSGLVFAGRRRTPAARAQGQRRPPGCRPHRNGTSRVTFQYHPTGLRLALGLSAGSAAAAWLYLRGHGRQAGPSRFKTDRVEDDTMRHPAFRLPASHRFYCQRGNIMWPKACSLLLSSPLSGLHGTFFRASFLAFVCFCLLNRARAGEAAQEAARRDEHPDRRRCARGGR